MTAGTLHNMPEPILAVKDLRFSAKITPQREAQPRLEACLTEAYQPDHFNADSKCIPQDLRPRKLFVLTAIPCREPVRSAWVVDSRSKHSARPDLGRVRQQPSPCTISRSEITHLAPVSSTSFHSRFVRGNLSCARGHDCFMLHWIWHP